MTAPPNVLWPNATGQKLRVIRDPSLRVRQAVRDNNVALLARLQHKTDLRNTDKDRLTSLSWAAIEGSLEAFEWLLLDYGHDDQELSRDADNNTILHLLASVPAAPTLSAHTHLLRSASTLPPPPRQRSTAELEEISLRMTQLYHTLFPFLLDWSNSGGKTALHIAAQAGNAPFISLLCDLGADVDLTDLQGNTPLHYASAWGHVPSIQCLLERGCQFASRNFEGFTASDFAYSQEVMTSLQGIAKTVFEERRRQRRDMVANGMVDGGGGYFDARIGNGGGSGSGMSSAGQSPRTTQEGMRRLRSESLASGTASVNSGSAVSSNPSQSLQSLPQRQDSLPIAPGQGGPPSNSAMSQAGSQGSLPRVATPPGSTHRPNNPRRPSDLARQTSSSAGFMAYRSPPPDATHRRADVDSPPPPVPPLPMLAPPIGNHSQTSSS